MKPTKDLQFFQRVTRRGPDIPLGMVPGADGVPTLIVFCFDRALSGKANKRALAEAKRQILADGGTLFPPQSLKRGRAA